MGLSNCTRADSLQLEGIFQSMAWLNSKIKIETTGALIARNQIDSQT